MNVWKLNTSWKTDIWAVLTNIYSYKYYGLQDLALVAFKIFFEFHKKKQYQQMISLTYLK